MLTQVSLQTDRLVLGILTRHCHGLLNHYTERAFIVQVKNCNLKILCIFLEWYLVITLIRFYILALARLEFKSNNLVTSKLLWLY